MSETLNAQDIAKKLQEQLTSLSATVDTHEVSTVDEVGDGIARVSGLKSAMAGELLEFKSSDTGETVFGLAQNLDRDEVGAVLFGAVDSIKEGDECRTTGRIMDIPVSRAMLGRVVNPLGQPIDGLGDIVATHRRPIEFKAPGVIDRTPVCEPVQTGLLAIDSMVPIGRGQRELIIGDRKTGKTAIAIDAILNQRGKGMVCIYVAIGQKASTVANIRETLAQHGALDYTIIVSATAADSAPMQYIAPMAGAAIGEFFMYNGEDGKPAGVDIDLAQLVADELGVELEVLDMDFNLLIESLKSGKGQLIAAGMTATPERAEQIDFSITYTLNGLILLVPKGSDIKTADDLAGKNIAVQESTTAHIYAQEELGIEPLAFKNANECATAVMGGKADAAILDKVPAQTLAMANPDALETVEQLLTEEEMAMGVAKGNEDLLEVVNSVLQKAMDDGTVESLTDKHLKICAEG